MLISKTKDVGKQNAVNVMNIRLHVFSAYYFVDVDFDAKVFKGHRIISYLQIFIIICTKHFISLM